MTPSSKQAFAEARANTYQLLADLYLHGVTSANHAYLTQIESLSALASADFEQQSTEHTDLFSLQILPFESVFVTEDLNLSGNTSQALETFYRRIGYRPSKDAAAVDHIGCLLQALAHLCGAEADAHEDRLEGIATSLIEAERHLLTQHVLRWWAPFAAAVDIAGFAFYAHLTELTTEILVDHVSDVGESRAAELPGLTLDLGDESTSLSTIARHLLTPAASGLFIPQAKIREWSRALDIPAGFGNRERLMVNLMRGAARFDQFSTVMQGLNRLRADSEAHQTALVERFGFPRIYETAWRHRLDRLGSTLDQIEALALQDLAIDRSAD